MSTEDEMREEIRKARAKVSRLLAENATLRAALAGVINCAVEPEKAKFAMMVPLEPIREIRRTQQANPEE